jgi:Zn finger protein HypA/HybF involved in hydrogenase expression
MIDWKKFDKRVTTQCECKCGELFNSHGGVDYETKTLVSKDPCPKCGKHSLRKVTNLAEKYNLRKL